MRYQVAILSLLLLTSLSTYSYVPSQTPQDDSDKPVYHTTGNEANVVGTISVTGTVPQPLSIDMSADHACTKLVRKLETEWFVTNKNKLQNVFVYLKGEPLQNYRFEVPTFEPILQHEKCRYSPHVMGLHVGQPLHIVNSDPTVHNTHPTPKVNQEWNFSQPPHSPAVVKKFMRPEVVIPFKCNQHPWEKAYVGVLKHPYFAVSDELGRFEIRNVPPGVYKLVVWHEKLGEQERELTLLAGENRSADFTLNAP